MILQTNRSETLEALNLSEGDVVRVVATAGHELVVEITKNRSGQPPGSKHVSDWISHAQGSVRNPDSQSADELRMESLLRKHGLPSPS